MQGYQGQQKPFTKSVTASQNLPANLINAEWTSERLDLIKRTYCKGGTDLDLELFISTCKRLKLSPEAKQIYAVIRPTKDGPQMTIQTSIDGFRLIADRTDAYEGQTPVQWCGKDGVWRDIWKETDAPIASRVGVYKKGFREALYAVAHWDEYVQKTREGNATQFWAKMPRLMLGKVAEALALRKAFPNELSGIYATEEIGQTIDVAPADHPARQMTKEEQSEYFKSSARINVQAPAKPPSLAQKFTELNVSNNDLVEFVGKPVDQWTDTDIKTLKSVYQDLVDGKMDREDMLEFAKIGKDEK